MKWLLPKRHRTKRRPGMGNEGSNVTRWNKFDESTGQIYLETTAAIRTSDDLNWARDSRLLKTADYRDDQDYDDYLKRVGDGRKDLGEHQKRLDGLKNSRVRRLRGARSLQDAAIECILQNISDITLEGIECLPVPIVRRIWHAVNKRCSKSFNTWFIFSKILRQDDASSLDLLRYHQNINAPNCRLDVYTNPLISESYEFITSLSITIPVPIPDLIKLSSVKNLGVLEVVNTQGKENISVGDRLIRSWFVAALKDGAFSVLRILKLWNHEGLTTKSLSYLNGFPALALYDVQECGFDLDAKVEATRLGWMPTLDTNTLGLLETACVERAALMGTNLGMEARPPQAFCSEHLWHGSKVQRTPRGDIPSFLSQAPAPKTELVEPSRNKSKTKHLDKAKSRDHRLQSAARPRSESQAEAWDVPSYRAFARIGELRNDTDLVRAGVVVGDQAVVGSELVNSVPMVSLRLGESPSWLDFASVKDIRKGMKSGGCYDYPGSSFDFGWEEKPRLATSTMRGLAFIRIKVPTGAVLTAPNDCRASVGVSTQKEAGRGHPSTQAAPRKRQTTGIVRNKKRKLEDVLGAFL